MEAALEQGAEQLIQKVMSMALDGDMAAMRLCLERVLAARRDRVVHLELPPIGTVQQNSQAMSTIFIAGEGQITPAEGEMMANIVTAQTNIFQAEELESRIKKVESLLTLKRPNSNGAIDQSPVFYRHESPKPALASPYFKIYNGKRFHRYHPVACNHRAPRQEYTPSSTSCPLRQVI